MNGKNNRFKKENKDIWRNIRDFQIEWDYCNSIFSFVIFMYEVAIFTRFIFILWNKICKSNSA